MSGNVTNTGTITVDAGQTKSIPYASVIESGQFVNEGLVRDFGTCTIDAETTGVGRMSVENGGQMFLLDAVGSGQTVSVHTGGELLLADAHQFLGDMTWYAGGRVELERTALTGYSYDGATGLLTLKDGAFTQASFHIQKADPNLSVSTDHGGNGQVVF